MEEIVLHILKLNLIAAVVILSVKLLSVFLNGKFTAQWKYLVWFMISLSLLIPVKMPERLSMFQLQFDALQEDSLTEDKTGQKLSDGFRENVRVPISTHTAAVIFLILWSTIAVIKMGCEAAAYFVSLKKLKRMSIPVYYPAVIAEYTFVCRLKGIKNPPKLMQNAGLSTPLLTGLTKPELYLPSAKYNYTAEELKLIFCHELSHYLHRDLWYKMLLRICATVYWFNPFLLIMLKEAENDIENLCDAKVIRHCSDRNHRIYRRLLLRTAAVQNHIPYITVGLNDSTMVFKDRILYMLNLKHLKNSMLPGILLTLLLILTNVSFALSAPAVKPEISKGSTKLMETEETEIQAFEATAQNTLPTNITIEGPTVSSEAYMEENVSVFDEDPNDYTENVYEGGGTTVEYLSDASNTNQEPNTRQLEEYISNDAATGAYLPR